MQLWVAAESQPDILEVELRFVLSELVTVMRLEPPEVGRVMEFAAEGCGTQLAFKDIDWVEEGDWSVSIDLALYLHWASLQVPHVILRT